MKYEFTTNFLLRKLNFRLESKIIYRFAFVSLNRGFRSTENLLTRKLTSIIIIIIIIEIFERADESIREDVLRNT